MYHVDQFHTCTEYYMYSLKQVHTAEVKLIINTGLQMKGENMN